MAWGSEKFHNCIWGFPKYHFLYGGLEKCNFLIYGGKIYLFGSIKFCMRASALWPFVWSEVLENAVEWYGGGLENAIFSIRGLENAN